MSFTGGKLKLKGQDAGTKKKKKKKSTGDEKALEIVEGAPSIAVKVNILPLSTNIFPNDQLDTVWKRCIEVVHV